jgi:hypothetical protein
MHLPLGQILRLTGLVVEIPCVLGLLSLRQGKLGDWSKSPIDPATLLSIGIGAGFVLWIVGTIMTHWPAARRRPNRQA